MHDTAKFVALFDCPPEGRGCATVTIATESTVEALNSTPIEACCAGEVH